MKNWEIPRTNELNDLQNLKSQLETELVNSPLKQKAGMFTLLALRSLTSRILMVYR